jgi:hypothetical protein
VKEPYLEITFRGGRPIAAYYYLPRRLGQKSYRSIRIEPGMVVDLGRGGKPIGIEITAPSLVSRTMFNRVLKQFGLPAAKSTDLAPLRGARTATSTEPSNTGMADAGKAASRLNASPSFGRGRP